MISIPVIAALVGWLTNMLAIKMTFYPIRYVGRRPFGWQGIIPSKAHRMAGKAVDLITSKLLTIEEQFDKLDAKEIAAEMKPQLNNLSRSIVDQAMNSEFPVAWNLMPKLQRQVIYRDATRQFPATIARVLADVKANLSDIIDIRQMMVEALTREPELLNRIFLRCGEKEFKFIERSGLYFGFLFGIIQMFVWNYTQALWILPIGGLVVGYATNWLALKLIFRPVNPVRVGPIVIQGLFMKRQMEVSVLYARMLATELLTFKQMFEFVLAHRGINALADLSQGHFKDSVDRTAGIAGKTFLRLTTGSKGYERIREFAAQKFVEALPYSITGMFDYADRKLAMGPTLEEKLKALTKEEFEDVLHPVFKEDELTLILVGAALGGVAGVIQMGLMHLL